MYRLISVELYGLAYNTCNSSTVTGQTGCIFEDIHVSKTPKMGQLISIFFYSLERINNWNFSTFISEDTIDKIYFISCVLKEVMIIEHIHLPVGVGSSISVLL